MFPACCTLESTGVQLLWTPADTFCVGTYVCLYRQCMCLPLTATSLRCSMLACAGATALSEPVV